MPDSKKRPVIFAAVLLLALLVTGGDPAGAQTLRAVKERGTLNCGVSQGLLGFSSMDDKNVWTGFDVDFCRAVAAAIFDDPAKVTFMPLDAVARFSALQSNQIDVLSRNSTWTMSRESSLGLMFAGVAYYDGQGFLLRRDAGIDTALQLGGKTVCTQTGTTTELNVSDYFRANDMELKVMALGTAEESRKAYEDRKCDVLTSDVSQLYAERLKLSAPDQVDALFIDQCRGTGRQIGDRRRSDEISQPQYKAAHWHRRRIWRATGACERLGRAGCPRGRQLRGDL
jgi:general L-amino acid transport system substrate-binding protein